MISPTGYTRRLRNDSKGRGHYGAPRGKKIHKGVDYLCTPGHAVFSPITGIVVRIARPYKTGKFSGLLIQGKDIAVKIFYFKPGKNMVGRSVIAGSIIGTAQDISEKYGKKMKPHIHLEVDSVNPEIFIKMLG